VQVLKQAGDNLTRENVMKQAASMDMTLPMLLPGVNVKTGAGRLLPDRAPAAGALRRQDLGLFGKVYGP
jgi:branched-chain amino acid transport system substrate-binding protein